MLRKLVLALMPLTLITASATADDSLNIDIDNITDAEVEIVEADLDIDVDALAEETGHDSDENAIEACFRRCGYRSHGWRNCRWNSCYNHCYNRCHNYCRPLYTYRTISYCPPVCRTIITPVYSYYWGCH